MGNKLNPTYLDRSNLQGEWLLNGDGKDTAGTNDGTNTNVSFLSADKGYVSEVGDFNGSSSSLDMTSFLLNSLSVVIKPDATITTSTSKGFASLGTNPIGVRFGAVTGNVANEIITIVDGGNSDVFYWDSGVIPSITVAQHHIVLVWESSSSNYRLYYDNEDKGLAATFGSPTQISISKIGRFRTETSAFDGTIGLVRDYTSELTPNEINILNQESQRLLGPTNLGTVSLDTTDLISNYDDTINSTTWTDIHGAKDCVNTNVTVIQSGLTNTASFDGSSGRCLFTGTYGYQTSQKFTVSAWFKTTKDYSAATGWVFNGYGESNMGLRFNNSNKLGLFIQQTGPTNKVIDSNNDLNDGEWHHVIGLFDGTNMTMYIDNVLQTDTDTVTTMTSRANDSAWGAFYTGVAQVFDGQIALGKIYDNNVSTTIINNLFLEGNKRLFFPKYSIGNLEEGKVLEISRPVVSGTYYDQTGNSNNSTAITSVTDTTVGLNNSMTFNGTTSNISTTYTNNSARSYRAWVKYTTTASTGVLGNLILLASGGGFHIGTTTGKLRIISNTGSGYNVLSSPNLYNDGEWHQLVGTFNGTNTIRLYADGVEVANNTSVTIANGTNHHIGTIQNLGSRFAGDVISPEAWERELSPEEIQQDFYSNFLTN